MVSLEGYWSSYTHGTAVPARETRMTSSSFVSHIALIFLGFITVGRAQQPEIGVPVPPLGAGPFVFDTAEQHKIRVSVVTKGLSHPWAIAFLPDGSMLVTERPGRIRVIRNGVLDPTPIAGVPRVRTDGNGGLMDVALHPQFADKPAGLLHLHQARRERQRHAVARARPTRRRQRSPTSSDLLVPEAYEGNSGLNGRVVFGRDGMVYMSTGGNIGKVAQEPCESARQNPAPARRWIRSA